jgi:hypothetical protein
VIFWTTPTPLPQGRTQKIECLIDISGVKDVLIAALRSDLPTPKPAEGIRAGTHIFQSHFPKIPVESLKTEQSNPSDGYRLSLYSLIRFTANAL